MIDLGKALYGKNYHFDEFSFHQLIINPKWDNYPPLFMLCQGKLASRRCQFLLGISWEQMNQLLMQTMNNSSRVALAEKLGHSLANGGDEKEIHLKELLGNPLALNGLDISAKVRMFNGKSCGIPDSLYYFQLTDM
jgi:hypothetical protein